MPVIHITILNRPYTLSVPADQEALLRKSADIVNTRAKQFDNREMAPDRLVTMAALQITMDALSGNLGDIPDDPVTIERLAGMRMKLDNALHPVNE